MTGEKKKRITFHDMWELHKMKIKFYWNKTMLIHLCIVYACFHTTAAELNNICSLSTYHKNQINLQKGKYKVAEDL